MRIGVLLITLMASLILFGCGDVSSEHMSNQEIVNSVAFCHAHGMNSFERRDFWTGRILWIECIPNDLDLRHDPVYHPGATCAFCTKDDHV